MLVPDLVFSRHLLARVWRDTGTREHPFYCMLFTLPHHLTAGARTVYAVEASGMAAKLRHFIDESVRTGRNGKWLRDKAHIQVLSGMALTRQGPELVRVCPLN